MRVGRKFLITFQLHYNNEFDSREKLSYAGCSLKMYCLETLLLWKLSARSSTTTAGAHLKLRWLREARHERQRRQQYIIEIPIRDTIRKSKKIYSIDNDNRFGQKLNFTQTREQMRLIERQLNTILRRLLFSTLGVSSSNIWEHRPALRQQQSMATESYT